MMSRQDGQGYVHCEASSQRTTYRNMLLSRSGVRVMKCKTAGVVNTVACIFVSMFVSMYTGVYEFLNTNYVSTSKGSIN